MTAVRGMPPVTRRVGLTLALGGLMVVVDTTVTVVAVPAMVAGLGSTLVAVQWVTSAYLLGIVAVIPLAGWAANRFGARRVYVAALLVFTLFSALAGLAWDAVSLAVFRALQGLGGGLLNPVGQAIGMRATPRGSRGRLMSLLGLPLIVGPVLGPPLAGWLVDAASWRWIFLINVPVGLVAVVLCRRLLPADPPGHPAGRVDGTGLVLLSTGAVLTVLGCTSIDGPGAAVLAAGLLLIVAFAVRRVPAPLVDLRLLRHRPLVTALGVLATFGAGYFGAMAVLPIFVQGVRGDSAALAGSLVIPQAIAVGVTVQVATRLVDRLAPRRIVLTGVTLALLGAVGLGAATASDAPYAVVVPAAALLGCGAGATLMPAMTVAVRDLEGADLPAGTTLLALVQQLSAAIGVAVVATVLTLTLAGPTAGGGVAAMLALDPATRADRRAELAAAVGSAYVVVALLLLASLAAALVAARRGR